MAFKHGKSTAVLLGATDLSSYLNSADLAADLDTGDTTVFQASWKSAIAGAAGSKLELAGLYDPDLTDLTSVFGDDPGAVLTHCPAGALALGDRARLLSAAEIAYGETSPVGGVVAFKSSVQGDGTLGFGSVIHLLAEETASGNGTAVDMTAQSTTGAIAHIHATAVSATDTFDVTIEDSANGTSGWATIGTFASITAAAAERIVIAGTVERYVRVVLAVTDVSGDPSITFLVALART